MQGPNDRFKYPTVIPTLQLYYELEQPKITRKDWDVMPKPFQQKRDHGQAQTVNCRLCQATMDVSNLEDFTVACPYCKEATAIKNAPVGCKYVTCTCNALLVVDNKMQEVVCPRASCNKIIQLPTNQASSYGVMCSKCQYFFLHCTESCSYATCPKCRTLQRPLQQGPPNLEQNTRQNEDDDSQPIACGLICTCIMIGLFVAICAYVVTLEFIYSVRVGFLTFLVCLLVFSLLFACS